MKLSTIAVIGSLIAPSAIMWGVVAFHSYEKAPSVLYKGAFEQTSYYERAVPKDAPRAAREVPATIPIAAPRKAAKPPAKPPTAREASSCYLHRLVQGGSPEHPFVLICP